MSLKVQISPLCIKINHLKKYAFVNVVQIIKQTICEPQGLKLSSCAELQMGERWVLKVQDSNLCLFYFSGKMGSACITFARVKTCRAHFQLLKRQTGFIFSCRKMGRVHFQLRKNRQGVAPPRKCLGKTLGNLMLL